MPFSNSNDNINSNDLIVASKIQFDDTIVSQLPVIEGASNATIQFYLDSAGIAIVGAGNLGSLPIAKISEGEFRATAPAEIPAGLQLAYMGVFEVRGTKNLGNVQFVGLQPGVSVFADVCYYK